MENKDRKPYSIKFVRTEDKELIKVMYKWQISEDEKEKMCCTWLPEIQTQPYKEEHFKKFFNHMKKYLNSQASYAFLKDNDSEEYLGWINYSKYNRRNFSIEISYYFPKVNRKKGFGKIIMSLFLDTMFNFERMNLNKIYAETYEGNIGSTKLLEQLDFKIEGVRKDYYWFDNGNVKYDQLWYSLLREDWKKIK